MVVVFFVEWERFLLGEVVADVFVVDTPAAHNVDVGVDNRGKVGVVPFGVAGFSTEMLRGGSVVLAFFVELLPINPSVGVVLPLGHTHHGRRRRPCEGLEFGVGLKVFNVLQVFHLAPGRRTRGQRCDGLLFRQKGFFGGGEELGHKEESGEDEDVVNSD